MHLADNRLITKTITFNRFFYCYEEGTGLVYNIIMLTLFYRPIK